MAIFQKIFGGNSKPDNSKLLQLLDIYWKADGKGDTYENVVLELMNGNSFLMLPGKNEFNAGSGRWITTEEKKTIQLASIYTMDGLKALAAFTDEKALLDWAKKPYSYTSMQSQAILQLCEANGISRIVINNNSSNMFVLEKDRSETKEFTIQAKENVLLGIPEIPLDESIVEKMVAGFRNLDYIKEVYHYGQMKNNEFSLVLGFDLARSSENGKKAVIDVVRDVIGNEILPYPLDVFFIETGEWRDQIAAIEGALIYKI
ncbi:MAG TPA: SseB family protein [Puia sp.]|jgi:hypothetical protein